MIILEKIENVGADIFLNLDIYELSA